MSRFFLAFCAGTSLLTMGPSAMSAQNGSYDQNALRVDQNGGTISILRGVSETEVLRIGAFRAVDVQKVMSPSANAVAQAKIFEHDYRPGTWTASVGIATLGLAIGTSRIANINRGIPIGLTIASAGLISWGGYRLGNAYRALSRSIWWYNHDLKP